MDPETLRDLARRVTDVTNAASAIEWEIAGALGEIPAHSVREMGWDYVWWRNPGRYWLTRAIDSEGRRVESWSAPRRASSSSAAIGLATGLRDGTWRESASPTETVLIRNALDHLAQDQPGSDGLPLGYEEMFARYVTAACLMSWADTLVSSEAICEE